MSTAASGNAYALLSVSDKTGLAAFARRLVEAGYRLVSTGGTARALREAGLDVTAVEDVTGFPEILDGRVKTLHPRVHAGILARRELESHRAALAEHGVTPIDVVCVNLYPFEATVRQGAAWDDAIEQIDIGGPSMVRAAAKNHRHVLVVTDPADYDRVADALQAGRVDDALRRELAAKAFAHTAYYDAVIASYFATELGLPAWPERFALPLTRIQALRYGENPHQAADLYAETLQENQVLGRAVVLQGKELSYNNLQDAAAAWELVCEFERPAVVAIKHTNPCGVAEASDLAAAFRRAKEADPVSIFGGIVACNRPVDAATAELLAEIFLEVVIAPGFEDAARERLAERKNLRLLQVAADARPGSGAGRFQQRVVRSVPGGLLVQSPDQAPIDPASWEVPVGELPAELMDDVVFAWKVVKHVKSNAIVVAKDRRTLGVGAGQMNRVQSARLALQHAGEAAKGAVAASDAFLPFPDTLEVCADYGVRVLVQPGGSVRDQDVIEAARRRGVTMVFTGVRHFRH